MVLRCASVKALIEIFEESKKLFSDNCYYEKKYFRRKPLEWVTCLTKVRTTSTEEPATLVL